MTTKTTTGFCSDPDMSTLRMVRIHPNAGTRRAQDQHEGHAVDLAECVDHPDKADMVLVRWPTEARIPNAWAELSRRFDLVEDHAS